MPHTVYLYELFASGRPYEVSRTIFQPEKVARLLGFDVEIEQGSVVRASIGGKEIDPERMENMLDCISHSYFDDNTQKLEFDAMPPLDIFRLIGLKVIYDVNEKPRALRENELSLSGLLACGRPYRISRMYPDCDKAIRTLGFERKSATADGITRVFFRGKEIDLSEWNDVYFLMSKMYFDNLAGEWRNFEEFLEVMAKYDVEVVDDMSRKSEESFYSQSNVSHLQKVADDLNSGKNIVQRDPIEN